MGNLVSTSNALLLSTINVKGDGPLIWTVELRSNSLSNNAAG